MMNKMSQNVAHTPTPNKEELNMANQKENHFINLRLDKNGRVRVFRTSKPEGPQNERFAKEAKERQSIQSNTD